MGHVSIFRNHPRWADLSDDRIQAQASIMKELHNDLVAGSDEVIANVLGGQGRAVTEGQVQIARHILPWKNFWDFYAIHDMDPEIVTREDMESAASLCHGVYGEGFTESMEKVLAEFQADPGLDFDESVQRNLPERSVFLDLTDEEPPET